jgi:hypothetical protein
MLADAPRAVRTGDHLPISIQAVAYRSVGSARERMDELRSRYPDLPVFISTEAVHGAVYHKVMIGAVADTLAGRALREHLVLDGVVDRGVASSSWNHLQATPLAFHLGEFSAPHSARIVSDSLSRDSIFAYEVPIVYSDGSTRLRLYAGAYRDSTSADAMRARLDSAGIEAPLIARMGMAAHLQP